MKFYCYEYSNTAVGRAMAYNRSGGGGSNLITAITGITKEKAQIHVPAPVNFETTTSHNYQSQPTSQLNTFSNFTVPGFLMDMVPDGVKSKLQNANGGLEQLRAFLDSISANLTGFASDLPRDSTDAMFVSSGPSRIFEIKFNLPCLSEGDSKAAGEIVRAFEALSLPTARAGSSLTTMRYFHPPLWVFGIGPIDSYKFDPDWTGSPQICVLRAVKHRKTAFETNSLAALGHNGLLKPVAYTLTLQFQELEPAFRASNIGGETSIQITNRSGIRTSLVNGVVSVVGEIGNAIGGVGG